MEAAKAFRRVLVVGLVFALFESAAASRRRRIFFSAGLVRCASRFSLLVGRPVAPTADCTLTLRYVLLPFPAASEV